jgi:nucleoid-associated protein YejK
MKIKNAILHSLNNSGGTSVLSDTELDIESEVCSAFITKHVRKLMNNPASKEAVFNAGSEVYTYITDFRDQKRFFKDACQAIGQKMLDAMKLSAEIPDGDLLITFFEDKHQKYIAIMKLNYTECFTHEIKRSSSGSDNQIVKYSAVLPFANGKVGEAVLIPFEPMVLKVIEKPYNVNGEQKNYFSESFLDCDASLSKKEAAQILNELTEEITDKYYDNSIDSVTRLKTALVEQAEEAEGDVSIEGVAAKAFAENEDAKEDYVTLAREAGLRADMPLGEKFVRQQFGTQRIKAANGVELKFPAELWGDGTSIQMVNNDDGTTSILLNNLGELDLK